MAHIRVLDVSRVRAGPTCCRILGDFGADIIKIEAPPGIDPNEGISGARDGYDMINLHRNKRSLTLNLKERLGHEIFMRLVKDVDVVVENFQPNVKDRMGIGYEALNAANPRIILASIPGFGQSGPYRMRAGFDQIAQGTSELMWVTGMPGQDDAGRHCGGRQLGRRLCRDRHPDCAGRTRAIRPRPVGADVTAAGADRDDGFPGRALSRRRRRTRPGRQPSSLLDADGCFSDRRRLYQYRRRRRRPVAGAVRRARPAQFGAAPDYATNDMRLRNRPKPSALLSDIFKTKPSAQWLELLQQQGVPAGPIYKVDEVFADPQVQHLGIAEPLYHPTRGDVRVVGQPITMSRTPAKVVSPLPDPGAHTDEILRELG